MRAPSPAEIDELRDTLLRPLPEVPAKYFYDDRGSALFDAITALPEYYPTRTEEAILEAHAAEIVRAVRPHTLLEIGAGFSRKVRLLLDAMRADGLARRLTLFDINAMVLQDSVARVRAEFPEIEVGAVVGDFHTDLERFGPGGGRLVLFLAGTVGNLDPDQELAAFLSAVRDRMEPSDGFLLGVDLVKDRARLEAAYNDAAGVTAEFNRNMLRVLNARFGADFRPESWEHVAFWDADRSRIEMRLRASDAGRVRLPPLGLELRFAPGDELLTELSCKYTRESLERRLAPAGLRVARWFTDPEELFASVLVRRAEVES